jgi:opacity protein-like surface antigen
LVSLAAAVIARNMPPRPDEPAGQRLWGNAVSLSDLAKRAALAAVAVVAIAAARPAAAQLITPSKRRDAGTQGAFRAEYHFGDVLWVVSPFTGLDVTTRGGTYLYGGFGFDINFGPNWVLTPNGAAGWYQRGGGTPLGSWFEFRTGAELDYKFANQSRLGVAVHHMSNAGLTQVNPGEQSILLTYHMPLQ